MVNRYNGSTEILHSIYCTMKVDQRNFIEAKMFRSLETKALKQVNSSDLLNNHFSRQVLGRQTYTSIIRWTISKTKFGLNWICRRQWRQHHRGFNNSWWWKQCDQKKNRQMSIKVAQKWFHQKNKLFWHLNKNCLRMWEIWAN